MENLWEDLRVSMRSLARKPLAATVAVITLALGIGANAAMFSVIHAAMLSPLPYPEPERLVRIYSTFQGRLCCPLSVPNFLDIRARVRQFEDLVGYGGGAHAVTGSGEPVRLSGNRVTHGFFELLGAAPQIGRFFDEADDTFGAEPVVVLSDRLWRDRYAADEGIPGTSITIDSVPHTVIGVAPPDFRVTGRPQLFLPFAWDPENMPSRNWNFLTTIGRLRADTTREASMAEVASIYADLVAEHPNQITNQGVAALLLDEWLVGPSRRRPLLVLWGAVAMVLLVACANVVNLMLARAETRQRELAVRSALGAGRARLVRHFLTESLLVSVLGAGLGVAGAWGGLRLLLARYADAVPRSGEVGISSMVLLFVVGAALATGLAVGLVPALQTSTTRLQTALREGGRGSARGQTRLRQGLVVVEVGAALILVLGAGLMLKSFWRLSRVDVGVDADRILTARISLPAAHYAEQPAIQAFYESFRDEVKRLPAVENAGIITRVPFSDTHNNFSQVMPEGEPDRIATFVEARTVDQGFFSTLGLALLQGSNFDGSETPDTTPVVVVNQELVRQLFPDDDGVGRTIVPGLTASGWQIVGVVEDLREHGPDSQVPPTIYFSTSQSWPSTLSLTVRTSGEPLDIVPDLRRIAGQLDPELPVFGINRLDQLIYDGLGGRRFNMSLLSIFAGLALALGAVGIYGVMAYSVEQRTRELGLRQALGASPGSVLRLVVSQGMRLAALGIAIGTVGAFLLRHTLASLLFEVSSLDPAVYVSVAGILALVATLACFVPAMRAATVDPMEALREE